MHRLAGNEFETDGAAHNESRLAKLKVQCEIFSLVAYHTTIMIVLVYASATVSTAIIGLQPYVL
jgi:hypothetical protein